MSVTYDIKQVTRYVLIKKDAGKTTDVAEFPRRDEAETALAALTAASIKDYGAVGDGVTDDTEYVRRAVAIHAPVAEAHDEYIRRRDLADLQAVDLAYERTIAAKKA